MSTTIGAYNYPQTLVAGNTYDVTYQYGTETNGVFTAVDITNLDITGAIVSNYGDVSPVATFAVAKTDPTNGFFKLSIDPTVSASLPIATLKYEVRYTGADASVDTLFRGNFFILAGIPS